MTKVLGLIISQAHSCNFQVKLPLNEQLLCISVWFQWTNSVPKRPVRLEHHKDVFFSSQFPRRVIKIRKKNSQNHQILGGSRKLDSDQCQQSVNKLIKTKLNGFLTIWEYLKHQEFHVTGDPLSFCKEDLRESFLCFSLGTGCVVIEKKRKNISMARTHIQKPRLLGISSAI